MFLKDLCILFVCSKPLINSLLKGGHASSSDELFGYIILKDILYKNVFVEYWFDIITRSN